MSGEAFDRDAYPERGVTSFSFKRGESPYSPPSPGFSLAYSEAGTSRRRSPVLSFLTLNTEPGNRSSHLPWKGPEFTAFKIVLHCITPGSAASIPGPDILHRSAADSTPGISTRPRAPGARIQPSWAHKRTPVFTQTPPGSDTHRRHPCGSSQPPVIRFSHELPSVGL